MVLVENLLKKEGKNEGATIVGAIMGIVLGAIVVYAVGIPVIADVVSNAGLTGPQATVANAVLVLLGVVPIVLVAQLF